VPDVEDDGSRLLEIVLVLKSFRMTIAIGVENVFKPTVSYHVPLKTPARSARMTSSARD
jgi:hypothetical protein